MKSSRPVSLTLNPFKFSWPFTALASITHRLTGVALFAVLLGALYLLQLALGSPAGFAEAKSLLAETWAKVLVLLVLAALVYHIFAGLKHLLLDFHIGDTYAGAKLGAQLSIVLSVIVTAALGVWLW